VSHSARRGSAYATTAFIVVTFPAVFFSHLESLSAISNSLGIEYLCAINSAGAWSCTATSTTLLRSVRRQHRNNFTLYYWLILYRVGGTCWVLQTKPPNYFTILYYQLHYRYYIRSITLSTDLLISCLRAVPRCLHFSKASVALLRLFTLVASLELTYLLPLRRLANHSFMRSLSRQCNNPRSVEMRYIAASITNQESVSVAPDTSVRCLGIDTTSVYQWICHNIIIHLKFKLFLAVIFYTRHVSSSR
jgi:hypothetical protein